MSNSHVLTLRVPRDLKAKITYLAELQGVSINQFALYMLTKGVTNMEATTFFQTYLEGYTTADVEQGFDALMSQIPTRADVLESDKMPD
jgi:hypothetical protein